jgi:hypothetical protein
MAYRPTREQIAAFERFSAPYQERRSKGPDQRTWPWMVDALTKDGTLIKRRITCKGINQKLRIKEQERQALDYANKVLLKEFQPRARLENAPKTIGDVIPLYLAARQKTINQPGKRGRVFESHRVDESLARRHGQALAHVPLDELVRHGARTGEPGKESNAGPLQDYLLELVAPERKPKPVSGNTAGNVLGFFSRVLTFASEEGYLPSGLGNYLSGREFDGVEFKNRADPPPGWVVTEVLKRAQGPKPTGAEHPTLGYVTDNHDEETWWSMALLFHILTYTGCRLSEGVGLTWDRVSRDSEGRWTIKFDRQYQPGDKRNPERWLREAKGRSRSKRKVTAEVAMHPELGAMFSLHLRRLGLGTPPASGYIVVGESGVPLRGHNISSTLWGWVLWHVEPIGSLATRYKNPGSPGYRFRPLYSAQGGTYRSGERVPAPPFNRLHQASLRASVGTELGEAGTSARSARTSYRRRQPAVSCASSASSATRPTKLSS